jgi:8-oxo-dGTP diphosphatase
MGSLKLITARGIVIKDSQMLLMERWRDRRHYFSIPGGHIEPGEEPAQTVTREILEETSLVVTVDRPVFLYKDQGQIRDHVFYLCTYVSGEPYLPEDSEEFLRAKENNRFRPQWVPIEQVAELPFGSWQPLRAPLLKAFSEGFSGNVEVVLSSPAR